jgi:hypothetical protein
MRSSDCGRRTLNSRPCPSSPWRANGERPEAVYTLSEVMNLGR